MPSVWGRRDRFATWTRAAPHICQKPVSGLHTKFRSRLTIDCLCVGAKACCIRSTPTETVDEREQPRVFCEHWSVRAWGNVSEFCHWLRLKSRPLAATMTSHVSAWGQSQHSNNTSEWLRTIVPRTAFLANFPFFRPYGTLHAVLLVFQMRDH